ncbi:RidA family protein [Rhizobium daejeonense]|uniref:RidA family protein n=1 Tax=Rhizobium daejeonense TaxID=240521 RepID=A0A6M1S5H1_9HYPH|nr:RidA family protein [Rhizobium daejeonense]NGO66449.1 RidA family protein [Rhizobium daejeonense]
MTQTLGRLNPPTLPDAGALGYSQITTVEPGRLAFISGQVAWQPGGERAPDDLTEQARLVVANARSALDAVGATPGDIAMVRLYVTDLTPERVGEAMHVVLAFLDGAKPSLTGIGVAALAGPDLQIEMEMVVRLPS